MPALPKDVDDALQASFLGDLPTGQRQLLFGGGIDFTVPASTVIGRPDDEARIALVLDGVFRMYYTDISGKSVTVRYAGPNEFMGIPAMVGGPVELTTQCLLGPAQVWVISAGPFKEACQTDAQLGWSITQEVTRRLYGILANQFEDPFLSVRDKLIKHLSRIADCLAPGQRPQWLELTQQTLAEAIGSSREVVARTLKELREDAIVKTEPKGITLLR